MSRSGRYRKNLTGDMMYHSFLPSPLPPSPALDIDDTLFNVARGYIFISKK